MPPIDARTARATTAGTAAVRSPGFNWFAPAGRRKIGLRAMSERVAAPPSPAKRQKMGAMKSMKRGWTP